MKSQQEYWNNRVSTWDTMQSPLIPTSAELAFQRKHLTPGGHVLILGATPQLCALALEYSPSVTAVDYAQGVIDALRLEGVSYVCDDWLSYLHNTTKTFDHILADGSLLSLEYPGEWQQAATMIYDRLNDGGKFTPRVYLSNDRPPKTEYNNEHLARFVPSMANLNEQWQVKLSGPAYDQYDVRYTFPPRNVLLKTFGKFTLRAEYIPDFEEGDRFISFVFEKPKGAS